MDHLFTINTTPDETARLNKTFESSDILKVGWNKKYKATDDETIGIYIDAITKDDSFEMGEFIRHEQAEQYKDLRQHIRKYIFTCFKNDGILQIEDRNIKVEVDNFIKNKGDLKINLKKKKLVKTIEPFHHKDKNRNSKTDTEESRYYNTDAEREIETIEMEKEDEREQEKADYEKKQNGKTNKGEVQKESYLNTFQCFEQMMNKTILNELFAVNGDVLDPTEENIAFTNKKDDVLDNKNSIYVEQEKSLKPKLEKDITWDGNENSTKTVSDEMDTVNEENETKEEKEDETVETIETNRDEDETKKDNTIELMYNVEEFETDKNTKDEEKKEITTKKIVTDVMNIENSTKKKLETDNLKKRKINRIEEGESETDGNTEENAKKGKTFQETTDEEIDIEKKKINEKILSITIMTQFRKKVKEWITFFPDIDVENFFFHLYFLVELWKDRKKACVHCGSTDCEFDEYNKSICANMYCFLCDRKMIEGSPCHNIRSQFLILRKTSLNFLKDLQDTYSFDQFGASCFTCSSSKHQICGIPPNIEGAKTIDFRAFRIFETSLYNAVYEKNPFFIWDEKNSDFHEKVELVEKHIANKQRMVNKNFAHFPNQREEYEMQSRRFSSRADMSTRGGYHFFDERSKKFFEEQRDKKGNHMGKNERIIEKNEIKYYNVRTKNKNIHESQYFNRDHNINNNSNNNHNNNNKGHNINKSNTVSYANYKTNRESGYSKNNKNAGSRNMYLMDNSYRRRTNCTDNMDDKQDYKKKNNIHYSSANTSLANNAHMDGQPITQKNSFFYSTQNLEPVKQKKWNLTKGELNKKNNFDSFSKSSKYRFYSSNSGKNDQNIYAAFPQNRETPFNTNINKHDHRNKCQTNFNHYKKSSFLNSQSAPLPLYKNVKPINDCFYDNFFYKGNKNEKNFGGNTTGMDNDENRSRGLYKTTHNAGKYKNKQNQEDAHCHNSVNNSNNNKTFSSSGFNRGRGNDSNTTTATATNVVNRNNNRNKNSSKKGNSRTQKNENTLRYSNNNKGNMDESFSNNALKIYRTKSTGSKGN